MRLNTTLSRLFVVILLALGLAQAGTAGERIRVVYHVNAESARHQMSALRSVRNHLRAEGDRITIRVVLQGRGVSMLVLPAALLHLNGLHQANATPQMTALVDELSDKGVQFEICANSLKRHAIDPDHDLYATGNIVIVPNGVAELARLQQRGYLYIKP